MGEANPRPLKYTFTVTGEELVIYAKAGQLSPYVGTFEPDEGDDVAATTSSVASHTRRRYPGDPGSTVDGHDRTAMRGGYKPEATLPGRNAWFEKTTGSGPSAVKAVDQFTFVGSSRALREFCMNEGVNTPWTLRLPSGKSVLVA
jgi:hypothetical protein